ncbi:MAG: CDP-diacylglycerol--serine O-phosphatidyltransferase, partial [uncultured Gemmatimonadaceae bacterium]
EAADPPAERAARGARAPQRVHARQPVLRHLRDHLRVAGQLRQRGAVHRARRRLRRVRRRGGARDAHRQPVRRGARLARGRHLLRPRAGDDRLLLHPPARGVGVAARVHLRRVRGHPARALQRDAGRRGEDVLRRAAEPRRRRHRRHLLLVQPDRALQPDAGRRPPLARDHAGAHAGARRADDQPGALPGVAEGGRAELAGVRRAPPRARNRPGLGVLQQVLFLPVRRRLRRLRARARRDPRHRGARERGGGAAARDGLRAAPRLPAGGRTRRDGRRGGNRRRRRRARRARAGRRRGARRPGRRVRRAGAAPPTQAAAPARRPPAPEPRHPPRGPDRM